MANNENGYDVFLSYARSDDTSQQWTPKLAQTMETIFRSLTGQSLQIFVDTRRIDTAQIWEERIRRSIERSSVMVAILSPSYFTSKWCGWEWDYFIKLEGANRKRFNLSTDQGLIFPLKLVDWGKALRLSPDEQRRIAEANQRQFIDLENLEPGTLPFERTVRKLIEDIIAVLAQLDQAIQRENNFDPENSALLIPKLVEAPKRPTISIGTNQEQFLQHLSEAMHATIIGFTNRNLVEYLKEALKRKQVREGPEAFWFSLRILFLSEAVLHFVDDELATEFPSLQEANARRIQIAGQAKRAISYFLIRANRPHQWILYEYNFVLPFVGAIFEMPDGRKIVQVATIRPGYSSSEHLFFEFSGMAGEVAYYQTAFEDVIRRSTRQEEIVLIGNPQSSEERGFVVRHARFRRSVLTPKPKSTDWIAAVVIMLWHKEAGKVMPLLQIRTSENATRELDMLSNISGYINQQDCRGFDSGTPQEFLLQESAYENAVYRELGEELGIKDYHWPKPQLVNEIRFYYPDRENFYFYLCRVQVEFALHRIQPTAQIRPWSLQEILQVRKHQVLSKAFDLLSLEKSRRDQMSLAAQVIADNLILHKQADLAERLIAVVSGEDFRPLKNELSNLLHGRMKYDYYSERRTILGLAGLQYRQFFSTLLPAYAEIGVEGASEYLEWLNSDVTALAALARLQKHYGDAQSIRDAELDV